jgi:hypothetical protein
MLPRRAKGASLCPVVIDPDVSDGVDVLSLVLTAVPRRRSLRTRRPWAYSDAA